MIRLLLATIAIAAASLACAQTSEARRKAGYSEPYDFKGIRLGITLSEFKAAPVPDDGDRSTLPAVYEPPSARCDEADQVGLSKCTWGYNSVLIAGRLIPLHWFEFIAKPGDAEPRLFRMAFYDKGDLNEVVQRYDVFAAALAERFGKPTAIEQTPVQNAFGAVFKREVRVWVNKHGKIALSRFEPSLEYNNLRYFIPEYVDYHNRRLAERERTKGPKL